MIDLAGLSLRNPVILAAGTAGALDEIAEHLDLSTIGALTTKSITREPREGNPPWRVAPVKAGMLNAIGLANPGVEAFVAEYAPRIPSMACPVIGSIAGFSIEDYVAVAAAFDALEAMPAIELNVSCPNVRHGTDFGTDLGALRELVTAARAALTSTKLFVKLPPLAIPAPTSITDLARAAHESGAEALSLCNTMPAMAIDVETGKPALGNTTGGLSGPAVHPIVTKIIHDVHRNYAADANLPIIGVGGVLDWRDAAEFILAGATAVQIGTGSFVSPKRAAKVATGLAKWRRRTHNN